MEYDQVNKVKENTQILKMKMTLGYIIFPENKKTKY